MSSYMNLYNPITPSKKKSGSDSKPKGVVDLEAFLAQHLPPPPAPEATSRRRGPSQGRGRKPQSRSTSKGDYTSSRSGSPFYNPSLANTPITSPDASRPSTPSGSGKTTPSGFLPSPAASRSYSKYYASPRCHSPCPPPDWLKPDDAFPPASPKPATPESSPSPGTSMY